MQTLALCVVYGFTKKTGFQLDNYLLYSVKKNKEVTIKFTITLLVKYLLFTVEGQGVQVKRRDRNQFITWCLLIHK